MDLHPILAVGYLLAWENLRELCGFISPAFYLKFSVWSKMNSLTLRVRLPQTLLVLLAIVNAAIDIGNCGPKIKPLR